MRFLRFAIALAISSVMLLAAVALAAKPKGNTPYATLSQWETNIEMDTNRTATAMSAQLPVGCDSFDSFVTRGKVIRVS
ncbi:MAG: hypothetical protein ACXVBY_22910, partial [Isosphaeraceae bacterium]